MTTISASAKAARDDARQATGQFGEPGKSEPAGIELAGVPEPSDAEAAAGGRYVDAISARIAAEKEELKSMFAYAGQVISREYPTATRVKFIDNCEGSIEFELFDADGHEIDGDGDGEVSETLNEYLEWPSPDMLRRLSLVERYAVGYADWDPEKVRFPEGIQVDRDRELEAVTVDVATLLNGPPDS